MRPLRALAHLVVALALALASAAQARAIGGVWTATPSHHGHHAAAAAPSVAHCHGAPSDEAAASHEEGDCRTACCFAPGQLPACAPVATAVEHFLVRYPVAFQALSGRAFAPDPEIPKRAA